MKKLFWSVRKHATTASDKFGYDSSILGYCVDETISVVIKKEKEEKEYMFNPVTAIGLSDNEQRMIQTCRRLNEHGFKVTNDTLHVVFLQQKNQLTEDTTYSIMLLRNILKYDNVSDISVHTFRTAEAAIDFANNVEKFEHHERLYTASDLAREFNVHRQNVEKTLTYGDLSEAPYRTRAGAKLWDYTAYYYIKRAREKK